MADKDHVCGMTVKPETPHHYEYHGTDYRFCSAKCLTKFQASPESYLKKPEVHAPEKTGTIYTCPMHPEIRQPDPGYCPKCGMALEPESPRAAANVEYTCPMHPEIVRSEPGSCPKCGMALEPRNLPVEDNSELHDMTRRFWFSVALALPVFALAMISDLLPGVLPNFLSMHVLQ